MTHAEIAETLIAFLLVGAVFGRLAGAHIAFGVPGALWVVAAGSALAHRDPYAYEDFTGTFLALWLLLGVLPWWVGAGAGRLWRHRGISRRSRAV